MKGSLRTDSISVVTLGCPKNLVDSESILGRLHRAGYSVSPDVEDASLVVVNTCAFLTASQQESIDTILEVAELKKQGRLKRLIVSGCLAERHGDAILDEIEEIDYLLGPGTYDAVVDVADGLLYGDLARGSRVGHLDRDPFDWEPRVVSGHAHAAYVKISEGCNNTCTFCIIPKLRGKHRSRPIEDIVHEVERLAQAGVKEITIVAQDTTSYGLDLYREFALPKLLRAIDQVQGIEWVRLLYTYPRYWTDDLLACFGELRTLVPYVDMPIQHASDTVLKRMRRGSGWQATRELLEKIRNAAPGMSLRSTVITGFPGETDAEFEELLSFLRDFEFDNLGAFAYSTEDGTPAGEMAEQVDEELREERRARVLTQQRAISLRRNRRQIGRTLRVLVDSIDETRPVAWARHTGQALEIDGQVFVKVSGAGPKSPGVQRGEFVDVRIVGAGPYDLVATPEAAVAAIPKEIEV
ncbi:MAG: 30S ribosomal protein S12 methylthiotransferase RimO [Candidatus Eisenbacteria bacterium]|uniref:Ribosomal protein uS12 methylthiotransferase RimO n=1 Tax=Eiseniibacteriota bacterium TaxID=2212470 RepID=A0A956NA55_UNCEI|nr:30S ribosomal protein S12 methylthiotransferase RimO [Candidatus Eisenbacteria bacterium]MCB9462558.1 30S ribosomal protein S12 methylthiotransferase RimO [Candidatus Eisenbacteria bacterium]